MSTKATIGRTVMKMSEIVDRARSVARFRRMSYKTEKSYIGWISRYARWCAEHPDGEALTLRECSTLGPDNNDWTGEDDALATYKHWKQIVDQLYALAERMGKTE